MPSVNRGWGLALLGAGAAAWTPLASAMALYGTGLWPHYPMPRTLWVWWTWLPYAGSNPVVSEKVSSSAIFSALILCSVCLLGLMKISRAAARQAIRPGKSDNHGSATWMSMQKARKLLNGRTGVVVGEAYVVGNPEVEGEFDPEDKNTWGQGGKAPLLIDPCTKGPTHGLIFAGTGGYKTTRAITTLLHWDGPCVVLDPVGEMADMLRTDFESRGKRVITLSPDRPDDAERWGFNVLDWIDISKRTVGSDINAVVSWIWKSEPRPNNSSDESARFFEDRGKEMVTSLLAHMLWSEGEKTLSSFMKAMALPQEPMKEFLHTIYLSSPSKLARHVAGTLVGAYSKEFSGVYSTAAKAVRWLADEAYSDLLSGDSFHTKDLCARDIAIFIQPSINDMRLAPNLAKTIVGCLLNAIHRAKKLRRRALFALDEAAQLGRMVEIEIARDTMRKNGVTLLLLYQNPSQLIKQWGPQGKDEWYGGVSWMAFSGVRDLTTAKELSEMFGKRAVFADSLGVGGKKTGRHEIARPLILPQELMQARTDEVFVVMGGRQPLRCGAPIYFRRPELASRVARSEFA